LTIRNGTGRIGRARARWIDGGQTEGDVAGLVTTEVRELGTLELTVEEAVEFSVFRSLLAIRNL
jgi:hypothetical protein